MSRITKNLMNLNTEKIINEKIEIIEYLFHYIYYIYINTNKPKHTVDLPGSALSHSIIIW